MALSDPIDYEHLPGDPVPDETDLSLRAYLDRAARVAIDPATRGRAHLECRRHVEQVPRAVELDEYSLTVRAEQPEITVGGGEESIEAHVPLREHRMEHARLQ